MTKQNTLRKFLQMAALTGMTVGAVSAYQNYHFDPSHRAPAERTLHDLDAIEHSHHFSDDDKHRFDETQHHLKQFLDGLHEGGYFEEGKLREVVEQDLRHILDDNAMPHDAHDELERDRHDLKDLLDHHERH